MDHRIPSGGLLQMTMAGSALLILACSPYSHTGSPYADYRGRRADQFFGGDDLTSFAAGSPIDTAAPANKSPSASPAVPLAGLTPTELAKFKAGVEAFLETEAVEDGLGPIFNGNSCAACHNQPGPGGGSHFMEARFGRMTRGGAFESLTELGGSLQQSFSIGSEGARQGCSFPTEIVPPQADVRALRRATPLFGLGLVDNVPDDELRILASIEQSISPATAGHVAVAANVSSQSPKVSRFGWKAQVPTLFQFSGNAYANEMGITNPQFPDENCPNDLPNCELVQRCNPRPDLNNDGDDVQAFTDFMMFLAPLARPAVTPSIERGQTWFTRVGCASCHTPTLVTGPSPVAALDRKVFHPYSDFLLHDFAQAADQIGPDEANAPGTLVDATPSEMRTAPLWGIRYVDRFLHDGRARDIREAIMLGHEGQGAYARYRYQKLSREEQDDLVAFVLSL